MAINFKGTALPLTQSGIDAACEMMGVHAPEFWAVVFTETDPPNCGFWTTGKPQILYEQHVFHKLTHGRFDESHPTISNPDSGNYGHTGEHQYDRLAEAMTCDESAALKAASWGLGQTLGENFAMVDAASPQDLVERMCRSEDEQAQALAREVLHAHIASALRNHDWPNFARVYNGKTYWKKHYDETLAGWYARFAAGSIPDLRIRAAQVYLMYLGHPAGGIDGRWGGHSRSAMNAFQREAHLPVTEDLDDATFDALTKAWEKKRTAK